jgi:tetratricopeptide (TPR) repeat protein
MERVLSDDNRLSSDGCPSDETLAAWMDGRLERADADAVEEHVSTCEDCLLLVAAVSSSADEEQESPVSSPVRPERSGDRPTDSSWWRGRYLLPIAASVLLAASVVTVAIRPARTPASALVELREAAASADRRPTYGRLSGFAWAAPPLTLRSGPSSRRAVSPSLRTAVDSIEGSYASTSTVEGLHAYGVALLISGDTDGAIDALSRAAAMEPRDAGRLADASAAFLQRGRGYDDAEALAQARRLSEAAIALDGASASAWFNLAVIGRATGDRGLVDRARAALTRIEPTSPWLTDIEQP